MRKIQDLVPSRSFLMQIHVARFGQPAVNLVDAVANPPLSTHRVLSQHSRDTITAHSYRECSVRNYNRVINGWAMTHPAKSALCG